jgi:hypothetical protein
MHELPSGSGACACLPLHPLGTTHVVPAYERGHHLAWLPRYQLCSALLSIFFRLGAREVHVRRGLYHLQAALEVAVASSL